VKIKSAGCNDAWKVGFADFREVGYANFPLCFPYQTKESRLSKNAVARRASFAEGVEGGEKPQSSPPAGGEIPTEGRSA